tara:strand:+ start:123 stop:413 length:291 start_codon:yes stop_codon:yes gene_type:complete
MKRVILICLTVLLSGCSSLFNETSVKKKFWTTSAFMTQDLTSPRNPRRNYIAEGRLYRVKTARAIESWAKKYETDGLSLEHTRATAEIEYAKSGGD